MPITPAQAQDDYLLRSLQQYFDRTIKAAYDSQVLLTAGSNEDYSTPLRIRIGKPDDDNIVLNVPVIALDPSLTTEPERNAEIGTSMSWRHYTFTFCCFPAITVDGQPSLKAASVLKSYMQSATMGEFIKIIDFGNPSCNPFNIIYCSDGFYYVRVSPPKDAAGPEAALAQERHRFDMALTLKVPVMEVLST